jgi:hypothetical protein
MKKIIENLQALVDSINFAETEHSANYVITEPDKKLLNEALNEALQQHNVSGSLVCPNCGTHLQVEMKEMTNSEIIKALKTNDR